MVGFLTNRLVNSLTPRQMENMMAGHGALEATYMAAIMTGEDGQPLYPQAARKLVQELASAGYSDLAKDSQALGEFIHARQQDIFDLAKFDNGIVTLEDMSQVYAAGETSFTNSLKELNLPEHLQDMEVFRAEAHQHENKLTAAGKSVDLLDVAKQAGAMDTTSQLAQHNHLPAVTNSRNMVASSMAWMREHSGANLAIGTGTAAGAVGAGVAARKAWKNGHKGKATVLAAASVASAAVSATSWTAYVQSRGTSPSNGRGR